MSFTGRLDHRTAAPDMPGQPIRPVPIHAWVGLLVSACVVIVAVLWSFTGTLAVSVERAGVLTLVNRVPEAVTYVKADQAKMLRPGLAANVVLSITGEAFTGEVTRVALAPTTPEQAAAVASADVLDGSPIYEVRVTLSSSIFSEGSPCQISIVTGEARPISRVLPIFS